MDGVERSVSDAVLERARRMGPVPYSSLPAAGAVPRSPALPVWWMAECIDGWWHRLGRPDPFTVVELGAGDGSRARDLLGLGPESLSALRYIAVEGGDQATRLESHAAFLPVEAPAFLFPSALGDPDEPDEAAPPARGVGPLVTSLGELPVVPGPALLLAVGWLSRMASDRIEWTGRRWWEVRLAALDEALSEVLVPLEPGRVDAVEGLIAAERPEGARFALLVGAVSWMSGALRSAPSGALVVVDRWTRRTEPLDNREPPALALDQLARHRDPLDPQPEGVSVGLSAVTWSVG